MFPLHIILYFHSYKGTMEKYYRQLLNLRKKQSYKQNYLRKVANGSNRAISQYRLIYLLTSRVIRWEKIFILELRDYSEKAVIHGINERTEVQGPNKRYVKKRLHWKKRKTIHDSIIFFSIGISRYYFYFSTVCQSLMRVGARKLPGKRITGNDA